LDDPLGGISVSEIHTKRSTSPVPAVSKLPSHFLSASNVIAEADYIEIQTGTYKRHGGAFIIHRRHSSMAAPLPSSLPPLQQRTRGLRDGNPAHVSDVPLKGARAMPPGHASLTDGRRCATA